MMLFTAFLFIFWLSFHLAARSMKDLDISDIERIVKRNKAKGTFVFSKGKVKHYSSSLSSSSTSSE